MTPAGKLAGAATLVALFAGIEALVLRMTGVSPATVAGTLLGGFLGLISLAIEIGLLDRSARTFHAQGVQTTFISFVMRMCVVAPLTLLFMKGEIGVHHQAFALSYCGTFFLYLCWLTWETYHAPAQYRPKATAGTIVVRDRRATAGSAR